MKELSYGVREFQSHLGEALRAVENGDRVIITSRGRVVAELLRSSRPRKRERAIDRKLRRLAAQGKISLGTGGPIRDWPVIHAKGALAQLQADRSRLDRLFVKRGRRP